MLASFDEYTQAVAKLSKYAYAYYVLDDPIASDEEYDILYHEVKAYEDSHPQSISPLSPTQRVGGEVLEEFSKSRHLSRMWSLDDVFSKGEMSEWVDKILKSYPNASFVCSPKFDGASLNLRYQNGTLISAATRGDGLVGEEVLHNAKTIRSIPLHIPYKELVEIRGEVVIKKEDFESINNERLQKGEPLFANPRNAAAGSLRQLDSAITAKRKLLFVPWGIGTISSETKSSEVDSSQKNPNEVDSSEAKSNEADLDKTNPNSKLDFALLDSSFYGAMKQIQDFGFAPFLGDLAVAKDAREIHAHYEKLKSKRDDFEMLLDGMVIMLDSFASQAQLGWTSKSPRFACAYKFPALEKITKILSITHQVGRTGVITPVAELEPVEIEGAKISRATLHNYAEIAKKDIQINDFVVLIRSGDVIPKIIKSIPARRDGTQSRIIPPTHCPICDKELVKEDIFIRCANLSCQARVKESIVHFASKKALNIDGLGEKIIYLLYDMGKISSILDIYELKREDLADLEGFKDKKITNLLEAIQASKGVELWRVINALGIPNIGEWASKQLASSFGVEFYTRSKDEILAINGFGEEMAQSILEFGVINAKIIARILEIISPKVPPLRVMSDSSGAFGSGNQGGGNQGEASTHGGVGKASNVDNERDLGQIFAGKTFVITGTLSRPRDEIKQMLESLGARVSGSVSAKTDFVLCGDSAGSKEAKARALGVKIINEAELENML
ncbi:NAD-dependent DNA ligase LigA [Helicobacter macacae]|uniref:DNA ligase n=1 Tax=Helicobacter macacae MIT 99-5501 TaxID=1357400 RepID=V8C533_9HELI|nr:NAD-dependent DNA ligase LigA [Helicobacter macacae]ETD22493.1 DNA ligase, NAD-dependent [Helicobacter macacae MIT 99-5501]